jgi:hypothetical protein
MDQFIGHVLLVDGATRPIYQQPDGRQYILNEEGERVHGVWMIPEEESFLPTIVVEARSSKEVKS